MTNSQPLVTIITPVYNAAKHLPQTIQSVQAQSYAHFEMILVDDCSTDNSREVIQSFLDDTRLQLVTQPTNGGVASARNTGLEHAKGSYFCFLDSDDWWGPDKLQQQVDHVLKTGAQLSHMDYMRVSESSNQNRVTAPDRLDFKEMLKSNAIGNLTAMVSREAIGGTRFERIGHEDYVFWLSVMQKGVEALKAPSPSPCCFYRVHAQSLSANKWRTIKWQWRIYRDKLGLSAVASAYYLCNYLYRAVRKRM